jgi:hypothetical protein
VDETFRSKERRDKRAAEIRRTERRPIKLSSSSGDILSPDYVKDAFEDGYTRDSYAPNGFGGLSPKRWGKLYHISFPLEY